MGQYDNSEADWVGDILRKFLSLFDRGAFYLLAAIYQIFFNVASSTLLQGDTLKTFYSRIQIVLGIFILFKLAISLLQVIINPDQLGSDKSGQGFSQIVMRVLIALVMLVAVMPLNIPSGTDDETQSSTYNAHLNANGLLFGTLYELQDRVLEQNVIAKLVIGSPNQDADSERKVIKNGGVKLASIILKGFIRINLRADAEDVLESDNWLCNDNNSQEYIKQYLSDDITPAGILDMLDESCNSDEGSRYIFTYTPLVGAIVGIVFTFLILSFTLDIAIRAIKLAVLRLIAPIPIISYIDPKASKDGAFASWIKAVVSTYLDLFLRLAIVYFVFWVIQDIVKNGIVIPENEGMVGILSYIFIFLGLLFFAKQAPKFIQSALGIKSVGMSNIGLSGMLAGTAALLGGAGFAGAGAAAIDATQASSEAAAQGKTAPLGWGSGRDLAAQLKTGDPKAKGGIVNNARDRLARGAGIGIARRYGVTKSGLNEAKQRMFNTANQADMAKNLYDRFSKDPNSLTMPEKLEIQNAGYGVYDSATDQINMSARQKAEYQAMLQKDMYDKQEAAAKAKSNYEKASKFGDTHRVSTSFEEEFRPSFRERAGRIAGDIRGGPAGYMARRDDRRGEHQSIGQRVTGSNQWRPNTQNAEGGSSTHDNVDSTIDSV